MSEIHNRLYAEAGAIGEKAVQTKYGIIDSYLPRVTRMVTSDFEVGFPRLFGSRERTVSVRKGWERVAGVRCQVFEYRHTPAKSGGAADGRSMEAYIPNLQRSWVDPATNLILRFEAGLKPIADRPAHFVGQRMVTFRRVGRIPAETFRLPRGIMVEIPEPFRGVALPPGVKRKEVAGIGIGGVTRGLIEDQSRRDLVRKERARKRMEEAIARGNSHRAEKERTHIRWIDEGVTLLRKRLAEKPPPYP